MPVACCLLNVTRVTSAPVRTFSLLPACFIAGRKYIAAVLINNIYVVYNIYINIFLCMSVVSTGQLGKFAKYLYINIIRY